LNCYRGLELTEENNKAIEQGNGMSSEIYSNSVNFTFSIYDITMNFGVTVVDRKEPQTLVRIKMSPQHAKVMSIILAGNIERYERDIGQIVIPDDLLSKLKKGDKK